MNNKKNKIMGEIVVFTAISQIHLEQRENDPTKATVKENRLRLEFSNNVKRFIYQHPNGSPKSPSLMPTTQALLLGLITNVRLGKERGWMAEGEHMEYIFEELKKAFVEVSDLEEGTMNM